MLYMPVQCYEHRFGYCTNAKTCFNVHFRPILAERRVLLGVAQSMTLNDLERRNGGRYVALCHRIR